MLKNLSFVGSLAALACGSPGPEARAPAPIAATQTPAPASAAPVRGVANPAAPASPFHVIGDVPREARLFGVGERGFVASGWGILYSLVGDEVVHDPLLSRGYADDPMSTLQSIAGSWPDGAWLSSSHPAGRSGFTKLWRWDGKRWVHRRSTIESRYIEWIRPWTGGRQLAVEQAGMSFDAKFIVISGDTNVAVPAFTKSKDPQISCDNQFMVKAFDTLPQGDVVVAGLRCGYDSTPLGVARWAPGATRGTIDTLPGTEVLPDGTSLEVVGMQVRSATDITVAAIKDARQENVHTESTYLAHFDGTRWREVAAKISGVVQTFETANDRSLIVTTNLGELYMGSSFDTLAQVPRPAELLADGDTPYVESVWLRAPGDVWAIAQMVNEAEQGPSRFTGRYVLFHTRPATKPLPTFEEFERKQRTLSLPGPPVEWCETPFVLIYTLGKKAPPDYDYPSTRTALKGHKEFAVEGVEFVEFERMERRFFGARVPDFTLGKKLATLVKEKVPGSTPELVCHDPPPKRTLTMDLAPSPAAR